MTHSDLGYGPTALAVDPVERDAAYAAWRAAVDMSAEELEAWSKNPCSRKASLDPVAVTERNMRLLRKPKAQWNARDVRDAKRTASFIARMLGMPRGEPVSADCPYSKRDISLRNWARKGGTLRQTMSAWRSPNTIARLSAAPGDGVPSPRLVSFAGIPVFIDRPRGFVQRRLGPDGALLWERTYQVDYGFIPGTAGGDGEPLDVFLGPDEAVPTVWWANQARDDGSPDELKLLLGFDDECAARACYVAHIPQRYLGSLTAGTVAQIRALVGVNLWTALAAKPAAHAASAPLPPWLAATSILRIASLGSPDQPRDKDGKWTDGHGDAASHVDHEDGGRRVGSAARTKTHEALERSERKDAARHEARANKLASRTEKYEAKAKTARAEADEARKAADTLEAHAQEKDEDLSTAVESLREAKEERDRALDPDDPEDVRQHPPIDALEHEVKRAAADRKAARKAADAAEARAVKLEERADDAEGVFATHASEVVEERARAKIRREHAEILVLPPNEYIEAATAKALKSRRDLVEAEAAKHSALAKWRRADAEVTAAEAARRNASLDQNEAIDARMAAAIARRSVAETAVDDAEVVRDRAIFTEEFWRLRARDAQYVASGGRDDWFDDELVDGDGDGRVGAEEEDDDDEEGLSALPSWLAPAMLYAQRGPVILSDRGRSTLGPAVSAQLYLDRVVDHGLDAAPGALRETLAATMAAIEGAKSYAEVEERLVALAPDAVERSADLATLIEGAVLLGVGAGAWAVGEETDAS